MKTQWFISAQINTLHSTFKPRPDMRQFNVNLSALHESGMTRDESQYDMFWEWYFPNIFLSFGIWVCCEIPTVLSCTGESVSVCVLFSWLRNNVVTLSFAHSYIPLAHTVWRLTKMTQHPGCSVCVALQLLCTHNVQGNKVNVMQTYNVILAYLKLTKCCTHFPNL